MYVKGTGTQDERSVGGHINTYIYDVTDSIGPSVLVLSTETGIGSQAEKELSQHLLSTYLFIVFISSFLQGTTGRGINIVFMSCFHHKVGYGEKKRDRPKVTK